MNNGIQISYPRTNYLKLNIAFENMIENVIKEFMDYAKEPIQEDFTYTLNISHDEYSYGNYLSFVFYISLYTGGAHPDNRIFTITYDIKNDKVITIKDLKDKNPNILKTLSQESRLILSKNKNITEKDMLEEGTKPLLENFKNFAFTPMGILIFFSWYQIAPYASGSFKIIIPYQKLGPIT